MFSTFNNCLSLILPNTVVPDTGSIDGVPENIRSLTSFKNISLSLPNVFLFSMVLTDGKIASIFNSKSLDIFLAMFPSAALSPVNNLSSSKNS